MRQVSDSLPAMIWMCGADGRAKVFNQRWLHFTGSTAPQALDAGWVAGVHADDVAQRLAACRKAWPSREPFETEYRLRRADGEYRWMLDQAAPQWSSTGDFQGYVGLLIDITVRKRAEDELRGFSKAVEQSPSSVVITDLDGNIEYVNPKFTEVTGYTLAEVRGRNPRILKSGEIPAENIASYGKPSGQENGAANFTIARRTGSCIGNVRLICPIRDEKGRPVTLSSR